MNKKRCWYGALFTVCLFFGTSCVPCMSSSLNEKTNLSSVNKPTPTIDVSYIYNLTAALSNIIFTVYNESAGEIAKGRAYGTKGENKAAEILYENMSQLGLHSILEQLEKRPGRPNDDLLTKLDVTNYTITLNDIPLDCFVAPSWKGPRGESEQLNCTFSFHGLHVKLLPSFPCLYNRTLGKETEDFVFLGRDQWNDPNGVLPVIDLAKPYLDPLKFYILFHLTSLFNIQRETAAWYRMYPHCKGLLLSDFNDNCHDMIYFPKNGNSLPVIFISGNDGKRIRTDLNGSRINMNITQEYNTSVISYNVIGELKGTNEKKTILVTCLYDGWWNQGTADSAIGMAMVLGIAKYFIDAGITPKYTVKFVAFSGEEYDFRGAKHYEALHTNETILAVIDLNQLGFTQNTPRLTFDIVANKYGFLQDAWTIMQRSQYVQRTGNVTDIKPIWWISGYIPGNAAVFAMTHPLCKAMTVFKDGGWILHHRDGMNHTEGDVLKYFNWTDTEVTAEMMTNLTVALATGNEDASLCDSALQNNDPFFTGMQGEFPYRT